MIAIVFSVRRASASSSRPRAKRRAISTPSFRTKHPLAKAAGTPVRMARGVGTSTAFVRAERSGLGDGRVYHIDFTATDTQNQTCMGDVTVCVPHDQGQIRARGHGKAKEDVGCIDEGPKLRLDRLPVTLIIDARGFALEAPRLRILTFPQIGFIVALGMASRCRGTRICFLRSSNSSCRL
jgi:hypothetical protein